MSRFLHRPMFRRGGSTGEGITSGLTRPGYKRGRVVEPGGYQGDIDFWDLMEKYPEAREKWKAEIGDYPKDTSGADFWLNFGTNILAQPGGKPILQTLGTAAQDPLKQLQQQKAMGRLGRREEEKDFLNTYLTTQAELRGGEAGATYKHSDKARLARDTLEKMHAHDDAWDPAWTGTDLTEDQQKSKIEWEREKQKINSDLDQFEKDSSLDLAWIMGGEEGVEELQKEFEAELTTSEYSEGPMIGPDGNPMLDEDNEVITISEYYLDPENAGKLRIKLIEMTYQEIERIKAAERGWTQRKAKGGRAGYQGGELVEQEDVNIQTPRGDIAMQETVEEEMPSDQLSFQELRARLPVEITDDIIRLLVSSAAALGDFAQIQTQVDVDTFNSKYGVNLVLPSEA